MPGFGVGGGLNGEAVMALVAIVKDYDYAGDGCWFFQVHLPPGGLVLSDVGGPIAIRVTASSVVGQMGRIAGQGGRAYRRLARGQTQGFGLVFLAVFIEEATGDGDGIACGLGVVRFSLAGPLLFPDLEFLSELGGGERFAAGERRLEAVQEFGPARLVKASEHTRPLSLRVVRNAPSPAGNQVAGVDLVETPLLVGAGPAFCVTEPAAQQELLSRGEQLIHIGNKLHKPLGSTVRGSGVFGLIGCDHSVVVSLCKVVEHLISDNYSYRSTTIKITGFV